MFKPSPFKPSNEPMMKPIEGVLLSSMVCGLKDSGNKDLLLMHFEQDSIIAGVFTQSSTAAAPVDWCKKCLVSEGGMVRAIVVHSGYANAFTGVQGEHFVEQLAEILAEEFECKKTQIYVCATGVIGQQVPADKVVNAVPSLKNALDANGWDGAAQAIMTTDTFAKKESLTCIVEGVEIGISGISKGSGMIMPNMATMLSFIATDLDIEQIILQNLLAEITEETFNAISVDSDTSTNDTVLLVSSRQKTLPSGSISSLDDERLEPFRFALHKIMMELAMHIVKDGEGISKLIEISVVGAQSVKSAKALGLSIANSPLVKTAMAGSDPNWGRIVMAVGKSGEPVDKNHLSVQIGSFILAKNGNPVSTVDRMAVKTYMEGLTIKIIVNVGVGESEATVWTSDLTHGYIEINADYTT